LVITDELESRKEFNSKLRKQQTQRVASQGNEEILDHQLANQAESAGADC